MARTGTHSIPSTGATPKAKKSAKKKSVQRVKSEKRTTDKVQLEVHGLIIVAFGLLLAMSLLSFRPEDVNIDARATEGIANWIGPVGAHVGNIFLRTFGLGAFFLNIALIALGVAVLFGKRTPINRRVSLLTTGALTSTLVLLHILGDGTRMLGVQTGGLIGAYAGEGMRMLVSTAGTLLVAATALLVTSMLLLRVTFSAMMRRVTDPLKRGFAEIHQRFEQWRARPRAIGMKNLVAITGADHAANDDDHLTDRETRIGKHSSPVVMVPPIPEDAFDAPEQPPFDPDAVELPADWDPDAPLDTPEEAEVIPIADPTSPVTAIAEPVEEVAQDPKIVESDAMRKARTPLIAGEQVSLPITGIQEKEEYAVPPLHLLDYSPPNGEVLSRQVLKDNATILEEKLDDFGIAGRVVEIHPGPVITMYEFEPAPGIKISKIANLTDDLSMALAALRVRIVAPIPGKSVVGIEVPNKAREIVYLKEILSDEGYSKAKSKLTIALGKDIVGYPRVADLGKMPHLLVAGSTGSGKSVAVNSFICSLLYQATPDDVRFIFVDPKMLELSPYEGIPHLLLPVVTDPKMASVALKWGVAEMERRYKVLAESGVRNIQSYNTRVERILTELEAEKTSKKGPGNRAIVLEEEDLEEGALDSAPEVAAEEDLPEKLPFIVIVIDELADLMMVAKKDVEISIARLAQMARAAGIHLVIATQRPSVDVITGLIKANFPARMSFQVSSKIDSRTILDRQGAENLLGRGDMLFLPPGNSALTRIHGCFVSDDEVSKITEYWRGQGKPQYSMDILAEAEDGTEMLDEADYDEHYDEAVAIVAQTRQASISYLQRRLKIGYNRAARIIEVMEKEGVVGPQNGSSPREVFVQPV
jgi:DNA segregation ATPase FtsK/SpoIIIE-like protein